MIIDEEEEILYLSSDGSSDDEDDDIIIDNKENKENKEKNDKIISFASLPSDGTLYHKKQGQDEQQSDVLDSLQLLSISIENELELIEYYFGDIVIKFINNDIIFNYHSSSSICHDYKIIEFIINSKLSPIELIIKCLNSYPFDSDSCHCRALNCPLLSNEENEILKDKINWMAQQHTKQHHNCIIMILIYLETRLSSLNNKNKSIIYDMIQSPENDILNINSNNNSNSNSVSNIAENGFFDSLKSLHQNNNNNNNNDDNNNNNILPSSFTNLQDIFTTKTHREEKAQQEYGLIDDKLICPKMCGAVWGRNGQLIFFNNILRKRGKKNSKTLQIEEERDELKSFEDYNKFLAKCGANHVHSDELHSIRKRVFANHMDDDEDRFADEFVVGFSLSNQGQTHETNEIYPNETKCKYYPYKNAYLHRSVSFLHQQHHQQQHHYYYPHHHHYHYLKNRNNNHILLRMHQHRGTQHHTMPHLVLPSSHHIEKKRYKYDENVSSISLPKEGNARIFCGGIIEFIISCNFSIELAKRCKLREYEECNISQLCLYNANLCKSLHLNRLSKILKILSTFLETASHSNTLIPSPYHANYIVKFIKKVIDELYIKNEIQGIAIIACLLRQSQFVQILFYDESNNNNTGYLLQGCIAQYLRIIARYGINDINICHIFTT